MITRRDDRGPVANITARRDRRHRTSFDLRAARASGLDQRHKSTAPLPPYIDQNHFNKEER
jgi:hypothetical protein